VKNVEVMVRDGDVTVAKNSNWMVTGQNQKKYCIENAFFMKNFYLIGVDSDRNFFCVIIFPG